MSDSRKVAISIKDIHKEFILPQNKNTSLKQAAVNIVKKNNKVTQKVLDGVSFDIYEGDFFGIVGRNGSGKSTLLKLIAGVYYPTSGSIEVNGGLTPFIELGVGFNPELSGRDNVYLNGALLGFTRKQMDAMYDEIVEFAELGPFMGQKLKNYSSGMQVRLAFSIAIKADNDILIFDEVLAVGDASFQEKCIRQFYEFKKKGRTVVLVTHSMSQVEKFCNRAALLSDGKLKYCGDPGKAIEAYKELNMGGGLSGASSPKITEVSKDAYLSKVEVCSLDKEPTRILSPNESFYLNLTIDSKKNVNDAFMAIRICESENQFIVAGFDNDEDDLRIDLKKGKNDITVKINNKKLISGKYYMLIGLYESSARKVTYDHYNGAVKNNLFMVQAKDKGDIGIIKIDHEWL